VLGVRLRVDTRLEEGSKAARRPAAPTEAAAPAAVRGGGEPADGSEAAESPAFEGGEGRPGADGTGKREEGEVSSRLTEVEPASGGPDREPGRPAKTGKQGPEPGAPSEGHDAGRVKLVKDIFGAEMIEEITLGE